MKLRKWRKLQTNSHSSNRHSSHHGEKVQLIASKARPMMTKLTLDRDDRSMKTMNPYVEYGPVNLLRW